MRYSMMNDTMEFEGRELRRIVAMEDNSLHAVHTGDIGGWIESEANLSHEGGCWVAEDAKVFGNARVTDDAWIGGEATVDGPTIAAGRTIISGIVHVFSDTTFVDAMIIDWTPDGVIVY